MYDYNRLRYTLQIANYIIKLAKQVNCIPATAVKRSSGSTTASPWCLVN